MTQYSAARGRQDPHHGRQRRPELSGEDILIKTVNDCLSQLVPRFPPLTARRWQCGGFVLVTPGPGQITPATIYTKPDARRALVGPGTALLFWLAAHASTLSGQRLRPDQYVCPSAQVVWPNWPCPVSRSVSGRTCYLYPKMVRGEGTIHAAAEDRPALSSHAGRN